MIIHNPNERAKDYSVVFVSSASTHIPPIQRDVKTIEGRPNIDKYHDWEAGDVIRFTPSGGSRRGDLPCLKLISRVTPYSDFRSMLQKEGVSSCLPGVTSLDAAVSKYRSFHKTYPQLEEECGVVAFEASALKLALDGFFSGLSSTCDSPGKSKTQHQNTY